MRRGLPAPPTRLMTPSQLPHGALELLTWRREAVSRQAELSTPRGSNTCARSPPPYRSSGARRPHSRRSRSLPAGPGPRLSWGRRGGRCWLTNSRSRRLLGGETARDCLSHASHSSCSHLTWVPGQRPWCPKPPAPPLAPGHGHLLPEWPGPLPNASARKLHGHIPFWGDPGAGPPGPARCVPAPASPPLSHPAMQSFLHKQARWQTLRCH